MMPGNRGERSTWRKTEKSGGKISKQGIEIDHTERERKKEGKRRRERSVHSGKSRERFRRRVKKLLGGSNMTQSDQNVQSAFKLGSQGQDRSFSERQTQVQKAQING